MLLWGSLGVHRVSWGALGASRVSWGSLWRNRPPPPPGHPHAVPNAGGTPSRLYLQVLPIKGQGTADQGVEDDAQTPNVHLGAVVLFALEKFRGSVRWGPTEGVQFVSEGEFVAEPKIGYFDVHVGVQQQILRLTERGGCGQDHEGGRGVREG